MNPVKLYDDIYTWKEYGRESSILLTELKELGHDSGEILELACGTGAYLRFFQEWNRTGVDLCADSIACAQEKLEDATFVCADMKDTGLKKQFDVILCLFGGISYLSTDVISEALLHWRDLLKPNGILVVEPWIEEESIQFGAPFLYNFSCQEYAFSRIVVPERGDHSCVLNFFFLCIDREGNRHRFQQKDILYLRSHEDWKAIFLANGFVLRKDREGFLHESRIWYLEKK